MRDPGNEVVTRLTTLPRTSYSVTKFSEQRGREVDWWFVTVPQFKLLYSDLYMLSHLRQDLQSHSWCTRTCSCILCLCTSPRHHNHFLSNTHFRLKTFHCESKTSVWNSRCGRKPGHTAQIKQNYKALFLVIVSSLYEMYIFKLTCRFMSGISHGWK